MIVQEINLKTILRADLFEYCIEYIKKHTYFKSRDIAGSFLIDNGLISKTKRYPEEIGTLSLRVGRIIKKFKEDGLIEQYARHTYKTVKE